MEIDKDKCCTLAGALQETIGSEYTNQEAIVALNTALAIIFKSADPKDRETLLRYQTGMLIDMVKFEDPSRN